AGRPARRAGEARHREQRAAPPGRPDGADLADERDRRAAQGLLMAQREAESALGVRRARPRPSSLLAHVVTLVAFALFAIEIAVLVPFTYLYWQRLVELRREELVRQADVARPLVPEALFRDHDSELFQGEEQPSFEPGIACFIYTPSSAYRLTQAHELAATSAAPARAAVQGAFELGAAPRFFEAAGNLCYVTPVRVGPSSGEERP